MKKIVAATLVLVLFCGSAVCEESAKGKQEATTPASLLLKNDGVYVGEDIVLQPGSYHVGDDLPAGWYRVYADCDEDASVWLFTGDALGTASENVAGHCWFNGSKDADASVMPLLDGCAVHVGTSIKDTSKIVWNGPVRFELISLLGSSAATEQNDAFYASDDDKPVPAGMAAYGDEIEALIAAAPATVEEMNEVLAPFGRDVSCFYDMMEGVITESDIVNGRFSAEDWPWIEEQYRIQKETYALNLKAYEKNHEKKNDNLLLYEDDSVRITYSDFHVESFKNGSAYLKTEWLIENKTDEIIDVTCDSITVNGCAVHIGKFADVPPNSKYLNEWTNNAEQFMKFEIDNVETFSAILTINNGKKIQSNEITLE